MTKIRMKTFKDGLFICDKEEYDDHIGDGIVWWEEIDEKLVKESQDIIDVWEGSE